MKSEKRERESSNCFADFVEANENYALQTVIVLEAVARANSWMNFQITTHYGEEAGIPQQRHKEVNLFPGGDKCVW